MRFIQKTVLTEIVFDNSYRLPTSYRSLTGAAYRNRKRDRVTGANIGNRTGAWKAATVYNERFYEMAALPSSENIYYFRGGCSLGLASLPPPHKAAKR
jgi:hypothetical protein